MVLSSHSRVLLFQEIDNLSTDLEPFLKSTEDSPHRIAAEQAKKLKTKFDNLFPAEPTIDRLETPISAMTYFLDTMDTKVFPTLPETPENLALGDRITEIQHKFTAYYLWLLSAAHKEHGPKIFPFVLGGFLNNSLLYLDREQNAEEKRSNRGDKIAYLRDMASAVERMTLPEDATLRQIGQSISSLIGVPPTLISLMEFFEGAQVLLPQEGVEPTESEKADKKGVYELRVATKYVETLNDYPFGMDIKMGKRKGHQGPESHGHSEGRS